MTRINVREKIPDSVLSEFPEFTPLVLQLLVNRGRTTQTAIESFLHPEYQHLHDPFEFRDMRNACERIYQAIDRKELIAIHGDYDADGVSASAILQTALNLLGAVTTVYLPHREKDGYGLNSRTIDYLADQGAKLIITCDCGISNFAEISQAKTKGIDTIVTDHHQIPEQLPPAVAIIHPKVEGELYPCKLLAGGGVAFKLVQGLLRHQKCPLEEKQKEIGEKWLLDLAAISTVADMVELMEENRILVKYGMVVMSKNRRLGLQKLFEIAGIDPVTINARTIGFQIAPRINAAGRMDHANAALLLLTATEEEEAGRLAVALEQQNKDRQRTTESMYDQAKKEAATQNSAAIFVYRPEWSAGLTGLVAGKLVRDFNKPAFVLCSDGERIVGSGRGVEGINILDAVNTVSHLLLSYGGHPQACGFRFVPDKLEEVVGGMRGYYESSLQGRDGEAQIVVDAKIDLTQINWELMDYLQLFEPYGQGNEQPLFYTEDVRVVDMRMVGQNAQHLKMTLQYGNKKFPAIAFDTPHPPTLGVGDTISIVYHATINQWNGNREIQLLVEHISIEKDV